MIQVRDLSVSYQGIKALDGVNLHISQGEWVLLTVPSGCGKSTLARVVCGLIPNAINAKVCGRVRTAGIDPMASQLHETAQYVGMVFQNPSSQLFHLRVEDEIKFGLRNLGLPKKEIEERAGWALQTTRLSELADQMPANLSGGQKQCVAIAAVLAMQPRVIVLDEPTASLDDKSIQRVMRTLKKLRKQHGITILMIEHRLTAAMDHADRIIVMNKGKISANETPTTINANQQMVGKLGLRKMTEEKISPWEDLIQSNGKRNSQDEPLLYLDHVSAGYDGKDVINNINMEIYPGDFSALVGPNGSGKSTTALVAAGLIKPSRGKVIFNHHNKSKRPSPGQDVCLLFQDPIDQLFTESVEEEVAFGPLNYNAFDQEKYQEVLEEADLLTLRKRPPLMLSVGQQHRTALAACVAMRPKLVILDEPTLGQDWGHLQRLMNFLTRLNKQGTAILLISHDYKLVYRYAKRILLIEDGEIKMKGKLSQKKWISGMKEKAS